MKTMKTNTLEANGTLTNEDIRVLQELLLEDQEPKDFEFSSNNGTSLYYLYKPIRDRIIKNSKKYKSVVFNGIVYYEKITDLIYYELINDGLQPHKYTINRGEIYDLAPKDNSRQLDVLVKFIKDEQHP